MKKSIINEHYILCLISLLLKNKTLFNLNTLNAKLDKNILNLFEFKQSNINKNLYYINLNKCKSETNILDYQILFFYLQKKYLIKIEHLKNKFLNNYFICENNKFLVNKDNENTLSIKVDDIFIFLIYIITFFDTSLHTITIEYEFNKHIFTIFNIFSLKGFFSFFCLKKIKKALFIISKEKDLLYYKNRVGYKTHVI